MRRSKMLVKRCLIYPLFVQHDDVGVIHGERESICQIAGFGHGGLSHLGGGGNNHVAQVGVDLDTSGDNDHGRTIAQEIAAVKAYESLDQ